MLKFIQGMPLNFTSTTLVPLENGKSVASNIVSNPGTLSKPCLTKISAIDVSEEESKIFILYLLIIVLFFLLTAK